MKHKLFKPIQEISWNSAMLFSFTGLSSALVVTTTNSGVASQVLAMSIIASSIALIAHDPAKS